jgi:proteasome accessory factor B
MDWLRFENEQPSFDLLWDALEKRQVVEFGYINSSLPLRRVQPYGLTLLHGFWYLIGFDLDRQDIRTFKIARVLTAFTLQKKERSYEIPEGFSAAKYLEPDAEEEIHTAIVRIRKSQCLTLRLEGEVNPLDDDWDEITLHYQHKEPLLRKILWFGPDAKVMSPPDLVSAAVAALKAGAK